MAITNLYPNLPGHLVEFKDGGLQLRDSSVAEGAKSLLILGTALDGPINEPVAIDAESVAKLFGEDYTVDSAGNQIPNGTTLTKCARQAYRAGFNDIRCMRVSGSQASAKIEAQITETSHNELEVIECIANGNNLIEYEVDFPANLTSTQIPVIKSDNVSVSANGVVQGSYTESKYPTQKFKFTINPNVISASCNQIIFNYEEMIVDTSKSHVSNGSLTDTGNVDSNGDCIIKLSINGSSSTNPVYKFTNPYDNLGNLETVDNYGVPTTDLIAVTAPNGQPEYSALIFNVDGVQITPTSVSVDANGIYEVEFVEVGSAGTTAYTGNETVTMDYVGYTATPANQTQTLSSQTVPTIVNNGNVWYAPMTVNISDPSRLPSANTDIILYDASQHNIIAKMSDANSPITFDASTSNIIIDLTEVSTSVPSVYYAKNATMYIKYEYEVIDVNTEELTFRSIYGGDVYNECSVIIDYITDSNGNEGRLISLVKPDSKKYTVNETPLQYSSFVYPTFGLLKQAVESTVISPLNNVFEIITNNEDALLTDIEVTPGNSITLQFTEGSNGVNLSNDEMFIALSGERDDEGYLIKQGAYQILENYSCDYIYVAGIYADSTVSSSLSIMPQPFHYELALLCAVLTYRTKMTHGFIDVKPNTNTTLVGIQKWVEHLSELTNTFLMRDNNGDIIYDEDQNPMDIGWYTSVVAGPQIVVTSSTLGRYYGSPAIAYAALNACIAPQSAPTNKKVPGCSSMRFKLSNKQMNELTGNRMICFKYKNEGTSGATTVPYVVDGCTAGLSTSDYTRLTTVKVVTQVVDEVREVADPFIGEPNTVEQRNALGALISKRLSYLKEQGVILYYDFEITATNYQVLLGECSIALTLVAPQELRKITTVVALTASA